MPRRTNWSVLQGGLVDHGYLAPEDVQAGVTAETMNPHLADALRRVQEASGLADGGAEWNPRVEAVGHLDSIAAVLADRFCGVPDAGGGLGPLTFGSPGGRWGRGNLRVSVNLAGANVVPAGGNALAVVMGAFAQWQAVAPFFVFTPVAPGSGEDIRVIFDAGAVDRRFGTAGGVAASAGYPEQGNLQFDAAETWSLTDPPPPGTVSLLAVALHEIGHLLGLSHSNRPGGTMYPFTAAALTVDAESRRAINLMYGWRPQARLADRATSDRATLGVTSVSNFTGRSETPRMVWKGAGGDTGIYESELLGGGWSPQRAIGGIGSSHSPSLAEIGAPGAVPTTGLLMAWKGLPGDQGLYWSRDLGAGWEPQRRVPGVGSSARPAVANVNGQVFMAWKGIEGDQGIYWAAFDGVANWSPQANVAGVGTWDSPALVARNGTLHMFWRGIEGDTNGYHSSFDFANDPIWKPQRRIEYFSYETAGGVPLAIGTTGGLSACLRGGRILVAWKGVPGDSSIYVSLLESNQFGGQITVPGVGTAVGPSVVEANDQTFMAWRGIDDDSDIYWSQLG